MVSYRYKKVLRIRKNRKLRKIISRAAQLPPNNEREVAIMLHTSLLTIKKDTERKTAGSMELIQVEEFSGWLGLCGWDEEKGLYTRCRRCDEDGTGQASDGEHLNRFELEPIAYKSNGEVWGYRVVNGHIIETVEEEAARAVAHAAWCKEEKTVTLTNDQWSNLTCYLRMTTKYREGELGAWQELAKETDENGEQKFKNAPSNAEFWKMLILDIEEITKAIE